MEHYGAVNKNEIKQNVLTYKAVQSILLNQKSKMYAQTHTERTHTQERFHLCREESCVWELEGTPPI